MTPSKLAFAATLLRQLILAVLGSLLFAGLWLVSQL